MLKEGEDPNNPVRILTEGVFDCFHYGHARLLEQCKKMFKYVYLIVGVCADEDVIREKGKPIMSAEERAECVRQCKWVDEVIVNSKWLVDIKYLDKLGCKYIARDSDPYPCGEIDDMYAPFKKANRFLTTKRIGTISTTDLISRVIVNYDNYIEESIEKGFKPRDLGISEIKYFCYKIDNIFKKMQKRREKNKINYFFSKKENDDNENSGIVKDQIAFENIKKTKMSKKFIIMKNFFNKLIYKKNNPELYFF